MPPRILYNSELYTLADSENVLGCLLRAGHAIPHSCRAGMCHSCLMKAEEGAIPNDAQYGLHENLRSQNFFLACQCYPVGDMKVALCRPENGFFYRQGNEGCALILICAGKGIALLYDFARAALEQGHTGSILLYNIVPQGGDLYLANELAELAANNKNFQYIPCAEAKGAGSAADIIIEEMPSAGSKAQFYLCGEREAVNSLRIKIFEAGVSNIDIHVDESG